MEFFIDQRFRAAPCLSNEFLKSWFCNNLCFCALRRQARKILRDPERERAPVLREILKANVKIALVTTNPAHPPTHARGVTHQGSATAREGVWDGVETGALAVQYGVTARGGGYTFERAVSYPVNAQGSQEAGLRTAVILQ